MDSTVRVPQRLRTMSSTPNQLSHGFPPVTPAAACSLLRRPTSHSDLTMVSLARYIRHIRQTGIRAWWRNMQYIGDAKSGRMVGADQYAASPLLDFCSD